MSGRGEQVDIVIIGCGVMGASTAYQLSVQTDLDVVVLEKESLGSGSTGKSAGVIRFHYGNNGHYSRMVDRSYEVWENAEELLGKDIGFKKIGVLYLAQDGEDHGERAGVDVVRKIGRDIDILDTDELASLVPFIELSGIDYGVICREGAVADPYAATMAFYEQAREHGVRFEMGAGVSELIVQGEEVTGVRTPGMEFDCSTVISAAGPWSKRLLAQVGVDLPVTPSREQVMFVQPPDSFLEDYSVGFPHITSKSPGHVYFRPDTADTILVSGHHKGESCDPDQYSESIDDSFIEWASAELVRRVPALADAKFIRGYSGVYSNTPDKDFIIDEPLPGLIVLAGFSGHGFKHAPVIGEIATDYIRTGSTDIIDLDRFSLNRFTGTDISERESL